MDETLLSEKKYFEYIKNLELPLRAIEMMEILINEKDENRRISIWSNLSNCLDEKELKLLANPFYIGFGNPNSDFLFLGQEKAFDPKANKELLLLESINNNYYWDIIMNTKKTPNIFNPKFPRGYHNFKVRRGHTWEFYARVIAPFYELKHSTLINETNNVKNSLFNYCFISEVNTTPSKRNTKKTIQKERKDFLKNSFYKSFKYVIIGGKNSLGKEPSEVIEEIFNAKLINDKLLIGTYGKDNNKERTISFYESDRQKIILCHQLSGSAGWTDEHLLKLHNNFK